MNTIHTLFLDSELKFYKKEQKSGMYIQNQVFNKYLQNGHFEHHYQAFIKA